jgi:hypothetical protein
VSESIPGDADRDEGALDDGAVDDGDEPEPDDDVDDA